MLNPGALAGTDSPLRWHRRLRGEVGGPIIVFGMKPALGGAILRGAPKPVTLLSAGFVFTETDDPGTVVYQDVPIPDGPSPYELTQIYTMTPGGIQGPNLVPQPYTGVYRTEQVGGTLTVPWGGYPPVGFTLQWWMYLWSLSYAPGSIAAFDYLDPRFYAPGCTLLFDPHFSFGRGYPPTVTESTYAITGLRAWPIYDPADPYVEMFLTTGWYPGPPPLELISAANGNQFLYNLEAGLGAGLSGSAGDTTLTFAGYGSFASGAALVGSVLTIDHEQVLVTAYLGGSDYTVVRGYNGTPIASHSAYSVGPPATGSEVATSATAYPVGTGSALLPNLGSGARAANTNWVQSDAKGKTWGGVIGDDVYIGATLPSEEDALPAFWAQVRLASGQIETSTDGTTWAAAPTGPWPSSAWPDVEQYRPTLLGVTAAKTVLCISGYRPLGPRTIGVTVYRLPLGGAWQTVIVPVAAETELAWRTSFQNGATLIVTVGGPDAAVAIYRTLDDGQSWTQVFTSTASTGEVFLHWREGDSVGFVALPGSALLRSTDGTTWTSVLPLDANEFGLLGIDGRDWLARCPNGDYLVQLTDGTAPGFYRSRDGGLTWTLDPTVSAAIRKVVSSSGVACLGLYGAVNGTVLILSAVGLGFEGGDTRMLASYDSGATWTVLPMKWPGVYLGGDGVNIPAAAYG